ncbi:microtubule-associated protein 205 isoform 1-T5 [Glossina fuscipes fuscipes]
MDHEDTLEYIQNNSQYYRNMENRNMPQQLNVAGCGADGVSDVGGKYEDIEEHDAGDDNEWKYVTEVQQSEKQQSLKVFGSDDLAEKVNAASSPHLFGNSDDSDGIVDAGNKFVFGNGNANGVGVDTYETQQAYENEEDMMMGNGVSSSLGVYDEKPLASDVDVEIFTNDGEFSTTSNVTDSVQDNVPQVDVKIEASLQDYSQQPDLTEEEEPSTTNGTSSLSENPQQPLVEQLNTYDTMSALEDKENADPSTKRLSVGERISPPQLLSLEQNASQLNPDAKEFVPNFGSNPASPTSPLSGANQIVFGLHSFGTITPRQLIVDDDFVAASPRKTADMNMDAISPPIELAEFKQEAAQRPHELEQDDNEINDDSMSDEGDQQLPFDNPKAISSPFDLIDDGPETCVDLEINTDSKPFDELSEVPQQMDDDVMKRSVYVVNSDERIEDILNSVQPLPTDTESSNNSFIEENATETINVGDKELLQIEEKEHVSHSPSTEEMHINIITGEGKAIDDGHKVADISNVVVTLPENINVENDSLKESDELLSVLSKTNLPISIENAFVSNNDFMTEIVDECITPTKCNELENEKIIIAKCNELENEKTTVVCEDNLNVQEMVSSSPLSLAQEKHLVEETKESQAIMEMENEMAALTQQMTEMILIPSNDGHFSEEKEVETLKTTAIDVEYQSQMDADIVEQQFEEKLLSYENEPLDEIRGEYDQEAATTAINKMESSYNEKPLQAMTSPQLSFSNEQRAASEEVMEVISNLDNQLISVEERISELADNVDIELAREAPECDATDKINHFSNEKSFEEPLLEPEIHKPEMLINNFVENDKSVELSQDDSNVLTDLITKEPVLEEQRVVVEEPIVPESKLEEQISAKQPIEDASDLATTVAPIAVAAAAAAAAAVAASKKVPANKTQAIKKSTGKGQTITTAPAKLKVASTVATKKPDAVKQPITASKTTTSAVSAKAKPIAAATRKPAASGVTTTNEVKLATKSLAASGATTARPLSKTTNAAPARKLPAVGGSSVATLKPRPASAPAKPTLGLPAIKTKAPSPRSQIRKTTSTIAPSTVGKSAAKLSTTTATSNSGGNLKTTTTVTTTRTKSTGTSGGSSTGSPTGKTFTARPAPKFTNTVTTTTTTSTKRHALTNSTAAATGNNLTAKTSTAPIRKPSPAKSTSQTTTKTPTKTSGAVGVGQKAKTASNKITPNKTVNNNTTPKPIRKPQGASKADDNQAIQIQDKLLINGADDEKHTPLPNGDDKELTNAAQSAMNSGDGFINLKPESSTPVDA